MFGVTLNFMIVIILVIMLSYVGISIIVTTFAAKRAYATRPYSEKHGMVFDTKHKMLIGTTTPVFKDPKTGTLFLGKTKFDKR